METYFHVFISRCFFISLLAPHQLELNSQRNLDYFCSNGLQLPTL